MTSQNTIYVDMDDVLCHTGRHLLTLLKQEFGKQVAYEELATFDLGQAYGLQSHELDYLLDIAHRPDELLSMQPIDDAQLVLQQWQATGYEVAIVTGRPPTATEPSREWLDRHQMPYQTFLSVDKYGRFSTEHTIGITLAELATRQFCWAIEDSLSMATYVAQEMNTPVALLDRPWNQATALHPQIRRYQDWHQIAQALPSA